MTEGGVACRYAGPKEIIDAKIPPEARGYASIFESARAPGSGWTTIDDESFFRLKEQGSGELIAFGAAVRVLAKKCNHDPDGNETPENEWTVVSHSAEFSNRNAWASLQLHYGAVIEYIDKFSHGFMKFEQIERNAGR